MNDDRAPPPSFWAVMLVVVAMIFLITAVIFLALSYSVPFR